MNFSLFNNLACFAADAKEKNKPIATCSLRFHASSRLSADSSVSTLHSSSRLPVVSSVTVLHHGYLVNAAADDVAHTSIRRTETKRMLHDGSCLWSPIRFPSQKTVLKHDASVSEHYQLLPDGKTDDVGRPEACQCRVFQFTVTANSAPKSKALGRRLFIAEARYILSQLIFEGSGR